MSCSIRSCGFGRVQRKSVFRDPTKLPKGRKARKSSVYRKKFRRSRKMYKRKSRSRRMRKRKSRSRRMRKRKSRSFGFKYLRNDQIIDSVFHNYPNNLTCDRA